MVGKMSTSDPEKLKSPQRDTYLIIVKPRCSDDKDDGVKGTYLNNKSDKSLRFNSEACHYHSLWLNSHK